VQGLTPPPARITIAPVRFFSVLSVPPWWVFSLSQPPDNLDPLLGQSLGDFEIVALLGRGGMGAVYKARQASLDRLVAIKVLPQEYAADASFLERFSREARAAAALNHPNIVQVIVVGQDKGHHFIAMELVDGESLSQVLKRVGRLAPDLALAYLKQVASALAKAHAAGIVHRDIKPANLLLTSDGLVKVADFGLAKRAGLDVSVTATGASLGTPLYMPPEIAEAKPSDARSDLYSLGATFYHLLAGRPPFEGATAAELILKHYRAEVQPLGEAAPDAPAALCSIVRRLLRKDPAERFQTAAELLDALDRIKVGGASPRRRVVGGASVPRVSPAVGGVSPRREPVSPSTPTRTLPPQDKPLRPARRRPVGGAPLPRVRLALIAGSAIVLVLVVVLVLRGPRVAQPPLRQGSGQASAVAPPSTPRQPTTDNRKPPPSSAQWTVYTQWPFDAAEAKRRQEETAKALGVPVEQDIDIGNGVKMTFVLIPAGEFLMGSPPTTSPEQLQKTFVGGLVDEMQREFPQRRVKISKPFWLGKTEVTQAQWEAVMGDNPSRFKPKSQNPVERVNWNDCQGFLQKFSAELRKPCRLPTEAEWEYACRAGAPTEFYFGDSQAALPQHAWFSGNSGGSTHPVGEARPNAWGLHDMLGNVWEWCEDWFAPYDTAAQVDPKGPGAGDVRVARGGPWMGAPWNCRSARRGMRGPATGQHDNYGCRVCVVATTIPAAPQPQSGAQAPLPPPAPKAGAWNVYTEWPFDAAEAKRRQEETAKALGVPVEQDVDLGNGVKMTMVLIPAGEFLMGSPEKPSPEELVKLYGGKAEEYERERPQHRVRITKPFWLGKHELTQEQWQAVAGDNPSKHQAPREPVEEVTWNGCQGFLGKLNARSTRKGFRLPTEAEWEYACRAGSDTEFCFGDGAHLLGRYAWLKGVADSRHQQVGLAEANAWGFHDMHGNVAEWCQDGYAEYSTKAATDPTGAVEGDIRVVRGGSCRDQGGHCRSAYRGPGKQSLWTPYIGFRIAMSIELPRPGPAEPAAEPKAGAWKVYTEWPFDEKEAKRRQEETAKALGVPVEQDLDLGNGVKMTLVLIPAGEFLMGSPEKPSAEELAKLYGGKLQEYERELSQHRVRITRPFWLGKYEVTQEQWQAMMPRNPSKFQAAANPVEQVNWHDCQSFLSRLNKSDPRKGSSLPTEAQWEYACRAGSATQFHFGNAKEELSQYAWWHDNAGRSTHPVGGRKPNPWGLYDLHGNVSEWCQDGSGRYAEGFQSDPISVTGEGERVLRGGSWEYAAGVCRSTYRLYFPEGHGNYFPFGFRVSMPIAFAGPAPAPEPAPKVKAETWKVNTEWPFDAAEAKRRQEETAQALGVPVEARRRRGPARADGPRPGAPPGPGSATEDAEQGGLIISNRAGGAGHEADGHHM